MSISRRSGFPVMVELTEQQRQAVQEQAREPVELIDPVTRCGYVLLAREQYERMRSLEESECMPTYRVTEDAPCIPPGILRSQQRSGATCPNSCPNRSCEGGGCATTGMSGSGLGLTIT
jgi:hypothetical protein